MGGQDLRYAFPETLARWPPGENSELWRRVMLRLSVGYPLPPFLYLILETKELSKIRAGDL